MSEAGWKVQKANLESGPDYIIVRKSRKAGTIAGDATSEGKDGVATTYFEINKNDLGAAGGGGYDDSKIWIELDSLQNQINDLDIPDITDLATKAELAALKSTVDDHLLNHPAGGGDTVQLEADVAQLLLDVAELQSGLAEEIKDRELGDQGLQNQIDAINASGYDDTELRGLISDEEDARVEGDKDLQDQIDAIQSSGYDDTQIRLDFAAADEALQDQIDALEGFDPTALEAKDAEQDTRLDDIDEEQEEQNARLDALEAGDVAEVVTLVYHTYTPYNTTDNGRCVIEKTSGDPAYQFFQFFKKSDNREDVPDFKVGETITLKNNGPGPGIDFDPVTFTIREIQDGGDYFIVYGKEEGVAMHEKYINQKIDVTFHLGSGEETHNHEEFAEINDRLDDLEAIKPYDDSALAQAVSDNTEAISAIETEQEEQNTRLDGIDAGQEAQNKRLEALEKQGGTASGGSPYTTQLFYVNPTDPGKCVIREYGEKQSILLWMEDEDGETFAPYPKKGDEFAIAVWENGPDEEPTIISGIIDDINEPPPSTLTEIDLILPDGVAPVSLPANLNVSVGVTFGEDDGADLAALQAQVDQNTADIQTNTEAIDDKVGIATGQDSLTIWRGTEAEYNLVAVKDDNTLYVITG